MCLSSADIFPFAVSHEMSLALEDEDFLAIALMGVKPDGRAYGNGDAHQFHFAVGDCSLDHHFAFSTFEMRIGDGFYFVEIYNHIDVVLFRVFRIEPYSHRSVVEQADFHIGTEDAPSHRLSECH